MIKEYFLKLTHHWKILLKDKAYLLSFGVGLVFFTGAFIFSYLVSFYNDVVAYAPVGDFILDEIPTYNLEFLFVWGFYFVIALLFIYPTLVRPEIAPFTLKTYGILLLVRSCFIVLTHVGPPAGFFYDGVVYPGGSLFHEFMFRNDLFFSAHTAVPFLAFLLFRKSWFRWIMLAGSLTLGATVLLMHVHYSIDVFAAFFIAHGIYALSDKVFNNLNLRFSKKIKLYGWSAFQKKLRDFRDRKGKDNPIKEGIPVKANLDLNKLK